MLTCQQLTELVTDYLEGRLSFMERVSFQMHLGMCGHCREYLRQMKMTVRTLGKLPAEPIPAGARDDLLARFRRMQPRRGAGAVAASRSLHVLAAIENVIGSRQGWAVAGLILAIGIALPLALGLRHGPTGAGARCLLVELGAGGALVAFLGLLALAKAPRLSPSTFTVVAMTGALVGLGILQATCRMSRAAPHVLLFHVGGIILAGLLGLAASRLPALR